MKKILAIGPHPDDIELGCFGTMCKYVDMWYEVNFLVMTHGEWGADNVNRSSEAEKSAELLKCNLYVENLKDRYVSEGADTISVIEKYIQKIQPDTVFIPSMHDIHQDHRAVHKAAMVALRLVKEIFVYQSPSTTYNFKPNYYIDITKYIEKKVEAVKIHSSQWGKVYMADRAVKWLAEYRAFDIFLNDKYVEAFEVLKFIEY